MVSEKDFGRMLFLQIIFDTSKQSPKLGICKDTIEIESYQKLPEIKFSIFLSDQRLEGLRKSKFFSLQKLTGE